MVGADGSFSVFSGKGECERSHMGSVRSRLCGHSHVGVRAFLPVLGVYSLESCALVPVDMVLLLFFSCGSRRVGVNVVGRVLLP